MSSSWAAAAAMVWAGSGFCATLAVLLAKHLKGGDRVERREAWIVFFVFLVPYAVTLLSELFSPLYGWQVPELRALSSVVLCSSFWIAMKKYRLFRLNSLRRARRSRSP